jgi:uncharacterized protein (DUF983 family)
MNVTRGQILRRGLTHRCPNCGEKTLFKPGAWFELNPDCPHCGLKIERDEGFFLGSMSLNYGATVVGFITPVVCWRALHVIGFTTALIVAAVGAVGAAGRFSIVLSRSWWLASYYLFLPHHLPANQRELSAGEDHNT